jgi:hypothetical protein
LAFTTTTGAGGTSLIGTSGVDTTSITPSALTTAGVYIQAEGDADIVNTLAGGSTATNYRVLLGAGNDTLNVASAMTSSTVIAGDGTDAITVSGNLTTSTISGLNGVDAFNLSGNVTSSLINGNSDGDNITITAGTYTTSTVAGGQGGDTFAITGGTLTTGRFNGQDGDDTINITTIAAMASGASINGGQGSDTLGATAAFANALILSGDDGNDRLTGANGRDTLFGGDGADRITSDFNTAAGDSLVGGAGIDTFVGLTTGNAANILNSALSSGVAASSVTSYQSGVAIGGVNTDFDVITDFAAGAGGDVLEVIGNSFTLVNQVIRSAANPTIAANTNGVIAVSGTYSSTANTFTTAATDTTGPDTLVFSIQQGATNGTSYVLTGVNASQITIANLV